MRLLHFLTETEETSGKGDAQKKEKTPEQEREEQKLKDIQRIVDMVKTATNKNDLNRAVQQTAPLYKDYGEDWFSQLKKAMTTEIKEDMVERFMTITKNFSKKLDHIKTEEK